MTALAEEAARYFWHHSMDLGQGVVTKGVKSPEVLSDEVARLFGPINLAGRSVIDIGAWNGFFSFEAKRRGAARVLATDSFVWETPSFYGRESFDLARNALGLDVESKIVDIMNLSPADGEFDVTLFLGVFYHLADPIKGLQRAAGVTRDLLIVETHMDALSSDRPSMIFYPTNELGGDYTNWWGPNIACVAGLLGMVGFPVIYFQSHAHELGRGIFHGFRSAETASRYIRQTAAAWRDVSSSAGAEAARREIVEALDAINVRNRPGFARRVLRKIVGS